jgi:carbamoyl-phosphate synthase small subunit
LQARIALETGLCFTGRFFGEPRDAVGELVFHTGMTGYQEILTDPSYAGQIVLFTAPHIGNYGVHRSDYESALIHPAAMVVRDHCRRNYHRGSEHSLDDLLRRNRVPGISDVDTRALTIAVRKGGACRAAIGTADSNTLIARAQALAPIAETDWVSRVTTTEPYEFAASVPPPEGGEPFRVALLDFGIKRSIIGRLAAEGIDGHVLPAGTPTKAILTGNYEGVFLSNGPGDPASQPELVEKVRLLVEVGIPLFGICLGHQLLARAIGAETIKLPFGHHGANHPVSRLSDGRVEITSQNHNYAVPADSLDPQVARITHLSLNDQTVEGMELPGRPVYSVQFHPEAAPGPRDSHYLFQRFRRDMAARRRGKPVQMKRAATAGSSGGKD